MLHSFPQNSGSISLCSFVCKFNISVGNGAGAFWQVLLQGRLQSSAQLSVHEVPTCPSSETSLQVSSHSSLQASTHASTQTDWSAYVADSPPAMKISPLQTIEAWTALLCNNVPTILQALFSNFEMEFLSGSPPIIYAAELDEATE